MAPPAFVIVGAGLAGAKAAETLREEGFEGRVFLIGEEPVPPYERPPLTKDYLRGETPREQAFVHGESFYEGNDIELITDAAVAGIDPGGQRIALGDGRKLDYDRLLLTTGARPRRLPVPGAELEGVHYLRTLNECDVLRERVDRGERFVVVGGGWIGAEFAASARQRGADVTLVDPGPAPLARVLGEQIADVYRGVHEQHGVHLLTGQSVEELVGDRSVHGVRLSSGRVIDCDAVVVGIGVTPRTELAERAGLEIGNGVICDANLATTAPGIHAAGDVANAWHPFYGRHVRVEHWANALHQGPAAARAMLGRPQAYDRLPYFFSDQYDVGMEYAGMADAQDEVVIRGDVASREFIALWLRDGRAVAGMNVNVWDVQEPIQTLIRSGRVLDAAGLADLETALP